MSDPVVNRNNNPVGFRNSLPSADLAVARLRVPARPSRSGGPGPAGPPTPTSYVFCRAGYAIDIVRTGAHGLDIGYGKSTLRKSCATIEKTFRTRFPNSGLGLFERMAALIDSLANACSGMLRLVQFNNTQIYVFTDKLRSIAKAKTLLNLLSDDQATKDGLNDADHAPRIMTTTCREAAREATFCFLVQALWTPNNTDDPRRTCRRIALSALVSVYRSGHFADAAAELATNRRKMFPKLHDEETRYEKMQLLIESVTSGHAVRIEAKNRGDIDAMVGFFKDFMFFKGCLTSGQSDDWSLSDIRELCGAFSSIGILGH